MNREQLLLLLLPVFLVPTMCAGFHFAARALGSDAGYIAGFLFYWLFWCTAVPLSLSRRRFAYFFKSEGPLLVRRNWWIVVLFAATIVVPVFTFFLPNISSTAGPVILLGIPLAITHAVFEELLWQGILALGKAQEEG
jgi:hypothetical protein